MANTSKFQANKGLFIKQLELRESTFPELAKMFNISESTAKNWFAMIAVDCDFSIPAPLRVPSTTKNIATAAATGRVTVTSEVLEALRVQINPGAKFEVSLEAEGILLRPKEASAITRLEVVGPAEDAIRTGSTVEPDKPAGAESEEIDVPDEGGDYGMTEAQTA